MAEENEKRNDEESQSLSRKDIDALLKGGSEGAGGAGPGAGEPRGKKESEAAPFLFDKTGEEKAPREKSSIDMLMDVPMNVKIELGRTKMSVEDILSLGEGSVVELDKLAGDPVDVLVNDKLVARGEVMVVDDNFSVRITEIIKPSGSSKT